MYVLIFKQQGFYKNACRDAPLLSLLFLLVYFDPTTPTSNVLVVFYTCLCYFLLEVLSMGSEQQQSG